MPIFKLSETKNARLNLWTKFVLYVAKKPNHKCPETIVDFCAYFRLKTNCNNNQTYAINFSFTIFNSYECMLTKAHLPSPTTGGSDFPCTSSYHGNGRYK